MSTSGRVDRSGQLKGADFVQFYVMGHLAAEQAVDVLYDQAAYASATRRLVPDAVEIFPPVYAPQVSVLFQPLAALPYGWAVVVWWVVCITLYAGSCYVVWRTCRHLQPHGRLVCVLAVGSPAFFNLVAHGQSSTLALAFLVALFVGLLRGYRLLAGVALGLLIYKPQLGLAAGAVFLFSLDWPVVIGAALAAAAELAIGWSHYGTSAFVGYLDVLAHPTDLAMIVEQKLHQTHSLRTWWALLIPWRPVALTRRASAPVRGASLCDGAGEPARLRLRPRDCRARAAHSRRLVDDAPRTAVGGTRSCPSGGRDRGACTWSAGGGDSVAALCPGPLRSLRAHDRGTSRTGPFTK